MIKTVEIGSKQIKLASDGALPIVYRSLFPGHDYFADANKMTSGDGAITAIYDMMYAMAYNADPDAAGTDEMAWLRQFEVMDPVSVQPDVIEMLVKSSTRLSKPEKK